MTNYLAHAVTWVVACFLEVPMSIDTHYILHMLLPVIHFDGCQCHVTVQEKAGDNAG